MTNVLTDPTMITDGGVPSPVTEDAGVQGGSSADIPEKFWDEQTGEIRIQALLNSYKELEQKLSSMVAGPDTDEGRRNILSMLGMPDTADEYEIDVSHGFFEADPDINRKMHHCGFTKEQAQAAYDLAAEKFVPLIVEMAEEYRADREVERLISAFGGGDKWREVSRQLLNFGKKNLPPEVFDSMSGSYEGIMMMYKMMKGEDTELSAFQPMGGGGASEEKDLNAMMRDPRYWRDRDPEYVAKVTERFKRQYSA